MALNQVIYLPNPAGTYTKTVGATVTAAGTSTLQTAIPASTYVRVRNFSITMTGTGATGGSLIGTLKIGAGQITCTLITTSAIPYSVELSSDDIGFDGAWLQPADTITFIVAQNGANNVTDIKASCLVSLEDFTA
jgi:hypothetical protein